MISKEASNNQKSRVLQFIKKYGKITSLDAFAKLHITRLSACIFNLREDGYNIKTRDVEVDTVYGKTTFAEYYLSRGRRPNPKISTVTYQPTETTKVRVTVRRTSVEDRDAINASLKGVTRKEVVNRLKTLAGKTTKKTKKKPVKKTPLYKRNNYGQLELFPELYK